jgi:hypothetical protein
MIRGVAETESPTLHEELASEPPTTNWSPITNELVETAALESPELLATMLNV